MKLKALLQLFCFWISMTLTYVKFHKNRFETEPVRRKRHTVHINLPEVFELNLYQPFVWYQSVLIYCSSKIAIFPPPSFIPHLAKTEIKIFPYRRDNYFTVFFYLYSTEECQVWSNRISTMPVGRDRMSRRIDTSGKI